MRFVTLIVGLLVGLLPLHAATLERLTLDGMIDKSTEIIRGRVLSSRTAMRGPVIYTFATVQVVERWKGPRAGRVEVAVPGGAHGGLHQSFSGAPSLARDTEYVLFLWTGNSGITHVIGLSQGVFNLKKNQEGEVVVERAASREVMLDAKTGRQVQDEAMSMRIEDLRGRVERALAGTEH